MGPSVTKETGTWEMWDQMFKMWSRWRLDISPVGGGHQPEHDAEVDLWDMGNNIIGADGQTSEYLQFI